MKRLCWLFLFFFVNANAQNDEVIRLTEYLSSVETEFEILFSYADHAIESLYIPNRSFANLNQNVKHIEDFTYVEINQISKRVYALVLKEELNKAEIELIDLSNNYPISSFTISLKNLIFKSEDSSRLILNYPKSYSTNSLLIDAENYKIKRSSVANLKPNQVSVFYLERQAEELASILISNYIASGINKLNSGNEEIKVNKFKSFPGLVEADVLQNIQILPGVNSSKEDLSYLSIRGGTHDQNLFLWDGIKMYQTSHFFGMISAFSPYMIQSTEVSKNATNARYFDGVSGSVLLNTADQISTKSTTEIGFNLINADVFTDQPINAKSSIQISARHSLNFALNTPTYNSFFDKLFQNTEVDNALTNNTAQKQSFNFFDTAVRYLNQITADDFIRVNFVYHQNDFNLSKNQSSLTTHSSLRSELAQSNWSGGFNWKRKWNSSNTSEIQLGISEYTLEGFNASFNTNQSLFQQNKVQDWSFNWHHIQQWNKQINLSYGFQFNETAVTNIEEFDSPFFFSEERNTILVSGAYAGLNYSSKDKLSKLYLGGRINHFSKFNSLTFEPRLYFRRKFFNHFSLEVSAEQKSQATTQLVDLQTDFLGVENRRWVVANPKQRPILKSQQFELALQYFKNNWLFSIAGYVKTVEGIGTQSQGFVNQFQFTNEFGEYNVYGLDFLINKQFEKTSTWFSYSLMDNNYEFNQLEPSVFPSNNQLTHVINIGVQHKLGDFDFSTGLNWHSGVPFTGLAQSGNDFPLVFDSPNQRTLPNYFRLDASVNYTIELSSQLRLKSGLAFWNLTDKKNVYNSFFEPNQEEGTVKHIHQLGLGFTPNFMLRLIF